MNTIFKQSYQSLFSVSSMLLLSSSPLCCVIAISAWPLPAGPFILMNSTLAGPLHQPMDTLRATLLATLAYNMSNQINIIIQDKSNQLNITIYILYWPNELTFCCLTLTCRISCVSAGHLAEFLGWRPLHSL